MTVLSKDYWRPSQTPTKSKTSPPKISPTLPLSTPIIEDNWPKLRYMENNTDEESIFEEAKRLVNGDRQWAYDHPLDNCKRIGEIWATILELDKPIEPEKVALMMIGLKMARQIHRSTRDNLVDMMGYTACIDMIERERVHRAVDKDQGWTEERTFLTG